MIDSVDADLAPQIEAADPHDGRQGMAVTVTDTIMSSMERKAALARATLRAAGVNLS